LIGDDSKERALKPFANHSYHAEGVMLDIDIPDFGQLRLEHLVLDYNGTLAGDGQLLAGVAERLRTLSARLNIHVLTADTFGSVKSSLAGLPCQVVILPPGNQDRGKLNHIEQLNPATCVCIGNGRNDRLMLEAAALGIAVLQEEGASASALTAADVVCPSILAALDLLTHPDRLVATLRC
jgi:soluble P-type ATPase